MLYVHGAVTVGNLQGHAQQHAEYEEHGHVAALKQFERAQAQGVGHRAARIAVHGACRHRQRIDGHDYADGARGEQLVVGHLDGHTVDFYEIHEQFGHDEAYRAEHTDGRKCLHGVKAGLRQCVERHRVVQSDCRHEKCHRTGIEREQRSELDVRPRIHGIPSGRQHERARQYMAKAQHLLRRYETVGDDANQAGHHQRYQALDRVEPEYIISQSHRAQEQTQ